MWAYLLRRLVQAVLILLGVSFITFLLLYVLPADPVRQIAGRSATPQVVESIRRELGLDQPFLVQYWRYLGGLVQGDLGRSYLQRADVGGLIASRLPATLQLMGLAIVFELVIGLTMGVIAALWRGRAVDSVLMMTSFAASPPRNSWSGCCFSTFSPCNSAGSRSAATGLSRTPCCRRLRSRSRGRAGTRG